MGKRRRNWNRKKAPKPVAAAVDLPGNALATPETRRHFRKTSFARMCDKNEITGEMMRAAMEIEDVYLALTRGLIIKSSSLEKLDKGHGDSMPDRIAQAYANRYKPWADRLVKPVLSVVVDVVIDGHFVDAIDRSHRWRNGSARYLCQRALLEYAVMAHWARSEELIAFDANVGRVQNAA